MKTLIVYSSQTDNTKNLAQAIHENAGGEKDIFPVDDAPAPKGYDRVFVGFWLMAGKPDPKASEYLKQVEKGQALFLFATHGAAAGSDHVKNAIAHAVGLTEEAEIVGSFTCQGEVNPKVLEKVKQKPEPPVWIADADNAVGHPDDADIKQLLSALEKL